MQDVKDNLQADVIFTQRMKEYREEAKLSQQDIADKLEVKRASYAHYESGNRQPGYSFLRDFSKLSGWSPSYLLGLSKYKTLEHEADAAQLALEGDPGVAEAAVQVRQTAKNLLNRYNAGEAGVYVDYLELLARLCERIDSSQKYLIYKKDECGGMAWGKQAYIPRIFEVYKEIDAMLREAFLITADTSKEIAIYDKES